MIDLSTSEMNGDNITVQCVDAAGAEWCDLLVNIQTSVRQIDDLAFPATSGRSMVVDTAGLVDANTVKLGPTGSGTAQTARDLGQGIPNAVAGAAGGLLIAGSNAATTFNGLTTGAISASTITASGAVAFQSTFAVTTSTSLAALSATTITASGTTSLAAVTTSGTVTLNALTVSNATTLTGAVSLGSTLGVTGTTTFAAINTGAIGTGNITVTGTLSTSGTTTLNALTITNAFTVSGATTLTGAVTATNVANSITGVTVAGLTFTVPGQVDANVQYVNDVQVKGAGTVADPWNPV